MIAFFFRKPLLLLLLLLPAAVCAAEPVPGLTVAEHPWGRFAAKSWCRLQTTVWTNQDNKQTVSYQESLTTLESVEKDGLTFKETLNIALGGKWVENPPLVKRFDFYQEPILDSVKVQTGKPEKRIIGNTVVPCGVRIYEQTGTAGKRTTTVWYSRQIFPYVLRTSSVLRSIPTEKEPEEKIIDQTVTEVTETSAFSLWKSRRGTYHLRTTQKSGSITFITETDCSLHIPGGVIRKTTRELDKNGKELRLLDTRLINFFVIPEPVVF
ncbi:MAG: hypothetical protein LBN39_13370 [Planctomycetaceae bacterium]|jgi:hypothetical protein|nr:hypothetical protein [Planctomycetaceae bacterium]